MNKAAELLSEWFGSLPVIIIHAVLIAAWYFLGLPEERLISILSIEAIFLALFILRAENVAEERLEKHVKQILKEVKK